MRSPQIPSRRNARKTNWRHLLFLVAALVFPSTHAPAQPALVEPIFGVGDDEFLIGGWNIPPPAGVVNPQLRAQGSIAWARAMGVSVFRLPWDLDWRLFSDFRYVDALISAANATDDIRFFLCGVPAAYPPSYGREAKFYLLPDSVPYNDWQCKFLYLSSGVTDTNGTFLDEWKTPSAERIYDRSTVAVNTRIADSIVIDWLPERTSWWSQVQQDGAWCYVAPHEQQRLPARLFGEFWSVHDKGERWQRADTIYVAVTGHLIDEPSQAHPDSTILWIDVYYDIGRGEIYATIPNGVRDSADANISEYCTTLVVLQRDLAPGAGQSWDRYQVASLPFDASGCSPTIAGPLHPNAGVSQRINLRVRYAGNASVAIRSIALRDSTANAVLTENDSALASRTAMRAQFRARAVDSLTDTLHKSIIGIAVDGEQSPIQSATVAKVNRWMHEGHVRFDPRNSNRPDTINLWLEGLYREGAFHQSANGDSLGQGRLTMFAQEYSAPQDRRSEWKARMFDVDDSGRGAIFEHNGGKFMLPELFVDSASIEKFERQVQVRHLCQYLPGEAKTFPFQTFIADVARQARDQRKRLIAIPFASNNIWIHRSRYFDGVFASSDSVGCDRILEPAELRGMANMSIAMGAKGIFWQILSSPMDFMRLDTPSGTWYGQHLDWPISGGTTADTTATNDRVTSFPFTDLGGTTQFTMPDTFWTGWRIRSAAVMEYNRWLKRVGPELTKLRWRDAYSIHAQQSIPYRISYFRGCEPNHTDAFMAASTTPRLLPTTEIVTKVSARSLAGYLDPDSTTYVELGLFDMKPGRSQADTNSPWLPDDMLDTHFLVVTNRRVFEPTADITDSTRRAAMLAVTGTRRIELKLNLMNKGQFVFCRVTEVEADTSRLPGTSVPRAALDTLVPADSVVVLELGPGRASLLRITYVPWDREILAGRIEYSNQRKIVWDPDQRRYHCVYMKPNVTSSRFDAICYRRSKQIEDTTGSILWEREYELSAPFGASDSMVLNRHPSLTIRRSPTEPLRTIVTVVWTAHRTPTAFAAWQVLLRVGMSPDSQEPFDTSNVVEVVDSLLSGDPDDRWGTPVVSRLDGAELIAWSDSLDGIKARVRVLPNPSQGHFWWKATPTYTDSIHLSSRFGSASDDSRGRYPSVPTFAHIKARDSNVAIVWEQPIAGYLATHRRSDIYYRRLQHTLVGGSDTLSIVDSSFAVISNIPGVHRHPSISQHQDVWHNIQDAVAWESIALPQPGNFINVRSIHTPRTPNAKPGLWGWPMKLWRLEGLSWLYPNIASIIYRDSADTRNALSTIVHRWRFKPGTPVTTQETGYLWPDFRLQASRAYMFDGRFPTNSETPTMQPARHALLYESDTVPTQRLQTSRQFFLARARPVGYTAEGRLLSLRMSDSAGCGFSFLMADNWTADSEESTPLSMIERDTTQRIIGDLAIATSLLRTRTFDACDSTAIGVSLSAVYHGDTTGYAGSSVTVVVELIDSATAARVHLLDSVRISTTLTNYVVNIVDTLDLVSGRYYIRARVDTLGVFVPAITNDSRYPVGEFQVDILDSLPAFKPRRLEAARHADLRITAHPNPTSEATEARFTVPVASRVRVVVSDHDGRYAATLLDEWMEAGRYALDIDMSTRAPGRYVVQVHSGTMSGLVKVLVQH